MKIIKVLCLIFLTLLTRTSFATTNTCTPQFPYKNGWMGGDAVYSIALNNHKTLWLFGDTFIQPFAGKVSRYHAIMIHNSVAISNCNNKFQIHYYWKETKSGKPKAIFKTNNKHTYYWPKAGFIWQSKLYLFLAQVKTIKADAFGFKVVGTSLAIINNPDVIPTRWRIKYIHLKLPKNIEPGSAVVMNNNSVIVFTQNTKTKSMLLLRVNYKNLDTINQHWEYLGEDNHWHSGIIPNKAKIILTPNISEMSVFKIPKTDKWLAVYSKFPGFIKFTAANSLTGPWDILKHSYPLLKDKKNKNIFCYAAKAHQGFSQKELLITYACNSFDFSDVINNLKIYRPRILVLPYSYFS